MRRLAAWIGLTAMLVASCGKSPTAVPTNAAAPAATPVAAAAAVPFVGCAGDGQVGPQPAPTGAPKAVQLDAATAQQLAYYATGDAGGVLGPRGWNCFEAYGSDGSILYVAPAPIQSSDALSETWPAGAGPAIQVSWMAGDTLGRFTVAKVIARVFPSHAAYVRSVIAEGIEPASDFPRVHFPDDKIVTRSDSVVEYQTPAGAQGLGISQSRLTPNGNLIDGVAILQGQTPNLVLLAARLPPSLASLDAAIIRQLEADSAAASAPASPPPSPVAGAAPTSGDTSAVPLVQSFYAALGRADGDAAAALVIPQKRAAGPYSPVEISRFYGSLRAPVRLLTVSASQPDVVSVRYSYIFADGRRCDGAANISTVMVNGQRLIASIDALSGC